MACHPNGSHVVQTLLVLCSRISREDPKMDAVFGAVVGDLIEHDHIDLLVESRYATHVLATLVRTEAGLVPEDPRAKRKHTFVKLMTEDIYFGRDPFARKKSAHFAEIMSAVFDALQKVGFSNAASIPDASALLQQYIEASGSLEPRRGALFILY